MPTPLFRWDGRYWGFVANGRVYDRYGRHAGWIEPGAVADVYDRYGRFMGELREQHYVLRDTLRAEPVHLASQLSVDYPTPPNPLPDRDDRDPLDDWREALPWPLPPPDPPTR